MIGTKTPFRMSFIGGGSDLKEFYSRSNGSVLSTSINKYMYVFIHPFFDNRIQIKYSKTELVDKIEDIKHPIVRTILNKFKLTGIDINSIADIPSGTGLGSSSSYTVGLLHAIYKYNGIEINSKELSEKACEIEIDLLNEPIGKQDQYAAAYGGLNVINFFKNGSVKVEPVNIEKETLYNLQRNLLLFYTGHTRKASNILIHQKKGIINDEKKFLTQKKMTSLVKEAKLCLENSNLDDFGKILNKNWVLKRSLSKKISNSHIDDIYDIALKSGATGGKILGAGGGGFLLLYCIKEKQKKLRNRLRELREIEFSFDSSGSTSIEF